MSRVCHACVVMLAVSGLALAQVPPAGTLPAEDQARGAELRRPS